MSQTSPSDLVAAFRSFPRRLDAALAALDDEPGARASAEPHAAEVRRIVAEAAGVVGGGAGAAGSLADAASSVAAAIAAVDAEAWDDGRLDRLRTLALAAGQAVRAVEALAP